METLEATIILRKAKHWDLFVEARKPRIGQPFWVKSKQTGKFDNKSYLVQTHTNPKELEAWVNYGMVYVPASDLEINDHLKKQAVTPIANV